MKNNKYILYVISFLQGIVFYGAFSVVFRESRGISLSEIFLLESIFMILMLVFEIPWGIIGDKIGYKKTLIISYGIFLVSKIIFSLAHSFLGFLMESIAAAIAISGISGCDSALIYSSIDKSESDRVFGIYGAMSTAGFLMSAVFSGILVKISIDLLAFATIIPYALAFLLSFALKDSHQVEKHGDYDVKGVVKNIQLAVSNKKIIGFVIAVAVLSETTHSICVFFNQPLYIKSGINIKWFGILTALMQVATFISVRAHKIKKNIGEEKLLKGALCFIIICNLVLIKSSIAIITISLIFIIEGAFAMTQPITETIKNQSISTEQRATILSVYAMIANITAAVLNIIISAASKISLESALALCLLLNFSALIPMKFYLIKKATPSRLIKRSKF